MIDEIGKVIDTLNDFPQTPKKIKMNKIWLEEQINKGLIRKEDYKKSGDNFFTGIPVEVTDEIKTYEFVFKEG